jgi:hypothetical protein
MRNLVLKNQVIFGTVNADKAAFENAIDDLSVFQKKWPQSVRSLTRRFSVHDYTKVLLGPKTGIKNIISFENSEAEAPDA